MSTQTTPDLIPLAAAAVALGYSPGSAGVLASKGRFPVPIHKQGRYNVVARADVIAELRRRPHLTQKQYEAVVKAHREGVPEVSVSPTGSGECAVEVLSGGRWVSTAQVARILGVAPAVVNARHAAGTLPFGLEPDPESKRGGRRAKSLEVADYLAAQEPSWPPADAFSAIPSLSLAEVKRALGDDSPAGAGDPVTEAFLESRETISLADFALMMGLAPDTLKRRVQRGLVETVEDQAASERRARSGQSASGKERKLRRVRSGYAISQLEKALPSG